MPLLWVCVTFSSSSLCLWDKLIDWQARKKLSFDNWCDTRHITQESSRQRDEKSLPYVFSVIRIPFREKRSFSFYCYVVWMSVWSGTHVFLPSCCCFSFSVSFSLNYLGCLLFWITCSVLPRAGEEIVSVFRGGESTHGRERLSYLFRWLAFFPRFSSSLLSRKSCRRRQERPRSLFSHSRHEYISSPPEGERRKFIGSREEHLEKAGKTSSWQTTMVERVRQRMKERWDFLSSLFAWRSWHVIGIGDEMADWWRGREKKGEGKGGEEVIFRQARNPKWRLTNVSIT